MAVPTNITDIIHFLAEKDAISFASIDTSELDDIINDFLMTPDNGFLPSEEEYRITTDEICDYEYAGIDATSGDIIQPYPPDSTSNFAYYDWVCVDQTNVLTTVIDSTSPSITVLQWKQLYLEETYQDMFNDQTQIGISDHNSPNYPLVDFKGIIFDFDTASSVDYPITPDTTGYLFIEYEYPTSEKVDGMYIQGGDDGVQDYYSGDTTAELNLIAYYLGYSDDNVTWKYLKNSEPINFIDETAITVITAIEATDQQDAIDNPFWYSEEWPILSNKVQNITFENTAIEAKYWRLYMIDLLPTLTNLGWDTNYVGYTAAISHLRFQQYREHGEQVFTESVSLEKLNDRLSTAANATALTSSASGWFTHYTETVTNYGIKQNSYLCMVRVQAAGTMTYRIQLQNAGGAWVTLQTEIFSGAGDAVLLHADQIDNPNSDITQKWEYKFRLQDTSSGTPVFSYKWSDINTFRSALNPL